MTTGVCPKCELFWDLENHVCLGPIVFQSPQFIIDPRLEEKLRLIVREEVERALKEKK